VRVARAFVAGVLGESHPHANVAVLLASELLINSVRHSGSAVPGGLVTVAVAVGERGVRAACAMWTRWLMIAQAAAP
jgi:anti-sigma regulatory factor (Ser/Thr protein kinase)